MTGPAQGRQLRQLRDLPVTELRRLRPKKASALEELGIETVLDLVTTYPRRHIDRTRRVDVGDLAVGDEAVVLAEVRRSTTRSNRRGGARVELTVADDSGSLTVVFFNQAWRARQLGPGCQALFSGKLTDYRGTRQMVNPVVDVVVGVSEDGPDRAARTLRVIPVYPASAKAGLSSWEMGDWVDEALGRAGRLADPLPEEWRSRLGLVGRTEAFRGYHVPESMAEVAPARRRLAFDELFRLQLALVLRRRALQRDARAIRHDVSPLETVPRVEDAVAVPVTRTLIERFLAGLPFELTRAQRRALHVVLADMAGPLPMHRLLQGDVGSGKTIVALVALLAAVQGGHQGALMVPTEVLAEQHALVITRLVAELSVPDPSVLEGHRPLRVALLTSSIGAAERRRAAEGLAGGQIDLVVGTHALLTDDVRFRSLGLVVIDEQHRFGVEQRAALRAKAEERSLGEGGATPDLLVMTATPIPRTAAMVVFGDLDMTVIDELPPGRQPVTTVWARTPMEELGAWQRVREEVAAGRRAFVVCPLVEGSERVVARSAMEEHRRLSEEVLPGLAVGVLHGQMPSAEKEKVMAAFRAGEIAVLVATTVIEVGVDVPEATVMVVEDAGRFGIAQLHQLRGRVGRGNEPAWCYLLGDGGSPDGTERLAAMEETTDGFTLAEVDLRLRGQGTILGARQKGRSDLQLASLQRDRDLLEQARQVADAVTGADPTLRDHPLLADEIRLFLDPEEEDFLFKS